MTIDLISLAIGLVLGGAIVYMIGFFNLKYIKTICGGGLILLAGALPLAGQALAFYGPDFIQAGWMTDCNFPVGITCVFFALVLIAGGCHILGVCDE